MSNLKTFTLRFNNGIMYLVLFILKLLIEVSSASLLVSINLTKTYLLAFIPVNLSYLICGIGFAWSSPVLVKLPLTTAQGSTVASMLSLGMILGPFLSGALLDRIGRKATVGLSMALMTIANLILTFTNDMTILSTGRFLVGINCGIVYSCVPLFIAEISEVSESAVLLTELENWD